MLPPGLSDSKRWLLRTTTATKLQLKVPSTENDAKRFTYSQRYRLRGR